MSERWINTKEKMPPQGEFIIAYNVICDKYFIGHSIANSKLADADGYIVSFDWWISLSALPFIPKGGQWGQQEYVELDKERGEIAEYNFMGDCEVIAKIDSESRVVFTRHMFPSEISNVANLLESM